MMIKIALAGNPNCGKTTLFNALTGSNQFVGNWPGVTVEKKEGRLKGDKNILIMDLPGIYSLSPYTLEEVVARNFLINERPDVILNIIDGTNIERNLYLTTQLLELGIPVLVAVNMLDLLEKNGIKIQLDVLSHALGCEVVSLSALKGIGVMEAANKAALLAQKKENSFPFIPFTKTVETAIKAVEECLPMKIKENQRRFFAIKLLEQDDKIDEMLESVPDVLELITKLEQEMGDDAECIITNDRYCFITEVVKKSCVFHKKETLSTSDKIDRIVTNRFLALPIFAAVMFLVYYVSVTTVGSFATDWANDGLFGEGFSFFGIFIPGIPVVIGSWLEAIQCAQWLQGLLLDGIVAGVGAVLGFVPQMLILFLFLAFLEACGYMARVAFIMDRMFRKFGLSGKSFIPMLIGSGCGVPGIMASRTIESDRDRKMTIMTTTFIPCGAKLPIIALIAGALFQGAWWVAPSAYFIGIMAVVCSGVLLKKTKPFAGDPAPFVMELPAYHMPTIINVLKSMWERGFSFIKKAGSVILLSTILIWFTTYFGWINGQFRMLDAMEIDNSILSKIGSAIGFLFAPLGWGDWKSAVAAITGLVAKENVVGTFGILYGFAEVSESGEQIWGTLAGSMSAAAAYSFLVFNLLCAPCFAAMGAIKREMNNNRWFFYAIGYQTGLAYAVSFVIYQFGSLFAGGVFQAERINIFTVIAVGVLILFLYLLLRPYEESKTLQLDKKRLAKAG